MYTNILIPVSFDEERDVGAAVKVAQELASEGARMTFIHVLETIPAYVSEVIPPETFTARKEAAEERLRSVSHGVSNAHGVIVEGGAGRAITQWARENGADCIVIPSHRPSVSDIFLGSTAAWVVRHADCAVHVLR